LQQVQYRLQHRHRFLKDAVEIANVKLIEDGHEPIAHVTPHGLRRTYTSLLLASGAERLNGH
jgi:integrase